MKNFNGERILVLGGSSMLGRAISNVLKKENLEVIDVFHNAVEGQDCCDLCDLEDTRDLFGSWEPEFVIHCGGYNGNIRYNELFPATIYEKTARMALNVLTCAAENNVRKVVSLVSSCSYPPDLEKLHESAFFDGAPHPSVDAHGFAKRILLEYSRQLEKQYKLNSVCCVLNTCFGEYDSYDLNKTKVVGALIKKFVDAKQNGDSEVQIWGSGTPKRELLYAPDAAECVLRVLKYYNNVSLPINAGVGWDVKIDDLAVLIAQIVKFEGEIVYDLSRPDGQKRKLLDVTRFQTMCYENDDSVQFTTLYDALENTINWYKENVN